MEKNEGNIIRLADVSKEALDMAVRNALYEVLDLGQVDAVDMMAYASALEHIGKNIKKGLTEAITDKLTGEKGSMIERHGVKVVLKERKVLKFDHCDAWKSRKDELTRIEKVMKAIDRPMVDEDTGEMIQPAKEKYTTNILSCELPKESTK